MSNTIWMDGVAWTPVPGGLIKRPRANADYGVDWLYAAWSRTRGGTSPNGFCEQLLRRFVRFKRSTETDWVRLNKAMDALVGEICARHPRAGRFREEWRISPLALLDGEFVLISNRKRRELEDINKVIRRIDRDARRAA